ncbi:MAG: hypothetical protein JXB42_12775 [Deltaproteobacteria bacterium]|nr:hypothetical protein [Deltaproteobacteria bacterium]
MKGDWVKDTRVLSLEAKGAWIDLLCALWDSPTRGMLSLPWEAYARLIGATVEKTQQVITEIYERGVCNIAAENVTCNGNVRECNGNVTLINRRAYREEKERISTRYRVYQHRVTKKKRQCNSDVTGAYQLSALVKEKEKLKEKEKTPAGKPTHPQSPPKGDKHRTPPKIVPGHEAHSLIKNSFQNKKPPPELAALEKQMLKLINRVVVKYPRFRIDAFVQRKVPLNNGNTPAAREAFILALTRLLESKQAIVSPYKFCEHIFDIEIGNINERITTEKAKAFDYDDTS